MHATERGLYHPLAQYDKPQMIIDSVDTNYVRLSNVLVQAFEQAAGGKGAERHASGEPFEQQPICSISRMLGSIDGNLFQAAKKGHEARRLPKDAAVRELLGAINYLAACVILVEDGLIHAKT
jgi:hypothetical protein